MPLTETHNYIDIIKSNNAHLYSLNREEKKMYDGTVIKQTDYGLNRGKIIFEKEAKFVKYFYNSKFQKPLSKENCLQEQRLTHQI